MLKYTIIVLAIFGMSLIKALPEEMRELTGKLHSICVTKTGVSEDLITDAINGDFSADEKFKCYLKCIMAEAGCFSEDGLMDVERSIGVFSENIRAKVEVVIRKCAKENTSYNGCEAAWILHKCCYEADPSIGFVF
ncbi:general odorant-binding protein 83a isoform X2 [Aethina tumida]|uniref:general odorant-binding protein 83a isoform X2 n=1 Tax=Aethina tumida TaxID=116153 RepID=UPI00096AF21A|nr:general odorant-binding protein 83a isoform X2 [Aethina tumida]